MSDSPVTIAPEDRRELAHAAREALGIDDLTLAIHDASFPADSSEDVGRGSPYGAGSRRLCAFADTLGFNGLQLGPQGITTSCNRSPYDGTAWSRDPRSTSLLDWAGDPTWESIADLAPLVALRASLPADTRRVHYGFADRVHERIFAAAFEAFRSRGSRRLRDRVRAFQHAHAGWLGHDAAFEAHACEAGTDDPARWPRGLQPGPAARRAAERYVLAQCVVHAQHHRFRQWLRSLSWTLWGDLQVGLSPRDQWGREALFVPGYALGAPPSRTDPLGQPWGYPVLSPDSADAAALFRRHVRKMAHEYDGIRVDHPHGLVCPWVYRTGTGEPLRAVRDGARLHESPDLPEHPELCRHAIARPADLDRRVPRHADGWVRALDETQVRRYGHWMGIVHQELGAARGGRVACEVLSTAPYPLLAVMRLHDLGRFRVTHRADLFSPADVYRSEHAQARDWVMVATHDTPPLSRVVDDWEARGTLAARAGYLAERLIPDGRRRPERVAQWTRDRSAFLTAMFADLFASPARHVLIFMSDLFGLRDRYNTPGLISDDNWSLRLPGDFEALYRATPGTGPGQGPGPARHAPNLAQAMAMALRARDPPGPWEDLASRLDGPGRQ